MLLSLDVKAPMRFKSTSPPPPAASAKAGSAPGGPPGSAPMPPERVHQALGERLLVDGFPMVFDLERSQGSWIVDAITGERYLDFFTFFASLPLGFNHPALRTPCWEGRLLRSAIQKPSN